MNEIPLIQSWDQAWQTLESEFSFQVGDWQKIRLHTFYNSLLQANQLMNLTKHDSLSDFLTFHLLDTSLLLSGLSLFVKQPKLRYLDLGSGCGVPGFVFHVLLSQSSSIQSTLCESRQKRANYLKETSKKMEMDDCVRVVSERAERMLESKEFKGKFDVITARAFAKAPATLKIAIPFLRPGGIFLAQSSVPLGQNSEYARLMKILKCQIIGESAFNLSSKERWVTAISKAKS